MADTKMGREAENPLLSPDTTSRFLRIPKGKQMVALILIFRLRILDSHCPETRLEIYRYLLLPTPLIPLSHDNDGSSTAPGPTAESEKGFERNPYTDMGIEYKNSWEDDIDDDSLSEIIHELWRAPFRSLHKEDDERYKRDFAIVRTNRQIHSEAMSIFYSDARSRKHILSGNAYFGFRDCP